MMTIFKWLLHLITIIFVCALIYISPFWLKKYPFDKEEQCWLNTYDLGDTLLFTDGTNIDTLLIIEKYIRNPRNRFGFDWENRNIIASDKFEAIVIYDFEVSHKNKKYVNNLIINKSYNIGIDIDSSFGGLDFMLWNKKFNQTDTISAELSMCKLVINKDMHIPDFFGYKLTPKDGLIEYSFKDGRVYKLIKRIPVKDSKYYQEHKAE